MRASQTQLRTLTAQEKEDCKNCVQQLLVSAKESINSNAHGRSTHLLYFTAVLEYSHPSLFLVPTYVYIHTYIDTCSQKSFALLF